MPGRGQTIPQPPGGLRYRAELLPAAAEPELLDRFETLTFEPIVMKGVVARRTALRYGLGYDYDRRRAVPGAAPFPDWLAPVRDLCADFAGLPGEALVQALVQ